MDTIKKPANNAPSTSHNNTLGNTHTITKIRNGKLYTTEGAERIGTASYECPFDNQTFVVTSVLYRTSKGEFFEAIEAQEANKPVRTDGSDLHDAYTDITPIALPTTLEWAYKHGCGEAIKRLEELGVPEDNWDTTFLADFHRGTVGAEDYVHHIIYKYNDRPGYTIVSYDPEVSMYPQCVNVSISGIAGAEDFREFMYVHELAEIEAKAWAEHHLPVDVYIKCFGPVETA